VFATLDRISAILRRQRLSAQKWPDLREDHRRLVESPDPVGEQYALVNVEADRMTNGLNTLREQAEGWKRLRESR
jgi:sirohydrochlorin ferrochelatase